MHIIQMNEKNGQFSSVNQVTSNQTAVNDVQLIQMDNSNAQSMQFDSVCPSTSAEANNDIQYIQFSEANSGDDIESAMLNLFGQNKEINNESDIIQMLANNISTMQNDFRNFIQLNASLWKKMFSQQKTIISGIDMLVKRCDTDPAIKLMQKQNIQCAENLDIHQKFKGFKITTTEEMEAFEKKLSDLEFRRDFECYLRTEYSFTDKKSSQILFKTLLRGITSTGLFLPYSWKGLKRNNANTPFCFAHSTFVNLIKELVVKAFPQTSMECVDKMFENHLRFKNLDHKRESGRLESNKQPRAAYVRHDGKRVKRNPKVLSSKKPKMSPPPSPFRSPNYTPENSPPSTDDESSKSSPNESSNSSSSDSEQA